MMDWLRIYNLANIPFIEALDKTWKQYYPNEIDMLKDAVSIPGTSMTYVLNKALKTKKPGQPDLYTPGQPCIHTCRNCLALCTECKWIKADCAQCMKNEPYQFLKTSMLEAQASSFASTQRLESPKPAMMLKLPMPAS